MRIRWGRVIIFGLICFGAYKAVDMIVRDCEEPGIERAERAEATNAALQRVVTEQAGALAQATDSAGQVAVAETATKQAVTAVTLTPQLPIADTPTSDHIVVPTITPEPTKHVPTITLAPRTYRFSNMDNVFFSPGNWQYDATSLDATLIAIEVTDGGDMIARAIWDNKTDEHLGTKMTVACANLDDDERVFITLPDGTLHYAVETSCTSQRGVSISLEHGQQVERWARFTMPDPMFQTVDLTWYDAEFKGVKFVVD